MSIDPQGMAHIMGVLTNLYSDAPLAVLREYATNARDAHQAARVTRPVEIGLPTALDPILRVRDFGAGLSEQDIMGVYARYGSSTKRGCDEQVGAFGLGSKSAFTLAQQFVVNSVHDGWRTTVLFALRADGVGSVSVLHRGRTADPSGVQVEIGLTQTGRDWSYADRSRLVLRRPI
jgi:HSP90 family molecular chaperone